MAGDAQADLPLDSQPSSPYAANRKIMLAAILVLLLVVLLILGLHVYAKWFWRTSYLMSGRRRPASRRRRRRLEFAGEEGHAGGAAGVGLEKSVVDSLPTFVYKSQREEEALECAVCLCEFQEDEQGRLLPKCNHSFHTECIDMWFQNHSSCPLCRTSALPDPLPVRTEPAAFFQYQNLEIPHEIEAAQDPCESFHEEHGRQSSTDVLVSGDGACISSRMNSTPLERNRSSTRSLPHITVDIPRRSGSSFNSPRSSALGSTSRMQNLFSPRCSSMEEQSCSADARVLKSPAAHMKSFKMLVSRERRNLPRESNDDCEQSEMLHRLLVQRSGEVVQV